MARQNGERFWKEYYTYDITKNLVPGTGAQAFDQIVVRTDSDSDFELIKSTYVADDDRISIRVRDDSSGRYLIRNATDIKAIAGRGNAFLFGASSSFLPFIWSTPHRFPAATNFTVEARDYSGGANTLRLAFHGYKVRSGIPPWEGRYRTRMPFIYSFTHDTVTVAANGTSAQTIEVDVDAHFIVEKITGIRTGAALVTIGEDSRGRSWSNVPIHIDNLVGNGAFPNILPAPRFIARGSVIVVNIQDISGAPNDINIHLSGVKLYE